MSIAFSPGLAGNAAVMVMLLDDEQAAQILSRLEPEELKILGERMVAMGDIRPDAIGQAISTFVERAHDLGVSAHDRAGQVHSMMARAVGQLKADNLMQNILPDRPQASPIELVRWLAPQSIAPLIAGEHPQAIAVLLVQLDPDVAAQVLHALPEEDQPEIVHRIATLGPVHPSAMAMLEDMLNRRIAEGRDSGTLTFGGPHEAAEIINSSGKAVEKRVIPHIAKRDKGLAKAIEGELFKFEHLLELDPMAMGALLREVESEVLIDALKGLDEEQRGPFFVAMSSRAADGVRDEIEARGRVKLTEVVAAQMEIVSTARRLAAEGTIVFGSGDDDYV